MPGRLWQPAELWERHLTGWVAFSCRASFHGYEAFSARRFVCRHGAAGQAGSLGRAGAESRHWHEKKFGHGHMEGRRRRQLPGAGHTNASTQSLGTASVDLPVLARLGEALSNLG